MTLDPCDHEVRALPCDSRATDRCHAKQSSRHRAGHLALNLSTIVLGTFKQAFTCLEGRVLASRQAKKKVTPFEASGACLEASTSLDNQGHPAMSGCVRWAGVTLRCHNPRAKASFSNLTLQGCIFRHRKCVLGRGLGDQNR